MVQEIKVMRTSVTAREKERAERATLVQQEKLSKAKVGPHEYQMPEHWAKMGKPALWCDSPVFTT